MPVEYFVRFQGKCYDVGTKLKFYDYVFGIRNPYPTTGTIEKFISTTCFIKGDDGRIYTFSTAVQESGNRYVAEIIEPVYYNPPKQSFTKSKNYPAPWDVEIGWIWYIVIMVFGTIFNERFLLWTVATVFFFLWKSGRLGGNK